MSGMNTQANIEMIAYSADRHTKGALQLILSARPPEPRPPMRVAAGVPIRNEENTKFLRRDESGYARLRIPTAKGMLAAEATPAKLDTKSRTAPLRENEVRATSSEKHTRLATRSVLRGKLGYESAMCPNGMRNAPVVSLSSR